MSPPLPDDKDLAQFALARGPDIPQPGQVYRHNKGGLYSVVTAALREDTLEPLVIYRSNRNGSTWVRTLANFTEDVGGRPRFVRERD